MRHGKIDKSFWLIVGLIFAGILIGWLLMPHTKEGATTTVDPSPNETVKESVSP